MEAPSSEEIIEADKFPIEDEVLYSNPHSISKSFCRTGVGAPEENLCLFIDGQPQPLIIDDHLEKISLPISEEGINIITKGINMISEMETPHVKLKIYLSRWDKPLQVIAFMDIGEATSILNLNIIPTD
ncbi:hypothetical protein FXO38_17648 [Capsicum annuum]|nr:hypothetical protein FXO38_17648 [Capsicum annuum]KAF3670234.1 hypothetical protein FXO37_08643 [Capsicum annuum]